MRPRFTLTVLVIGATAAASAPATGGAREFSLPVSRIGPFVAQDEGPSVVLPALLRHGLMPPPRPTPGGATPTPTEAPPGLIRLSEVMPLPEVADSQWVEVANVGGSDVPVVGLELSNAVLETYRVPEGLAPLAPGAHLLVRFDGRDVVDGQTVHADRTSFVVAASDVITLTAPSGAMLDTVAWGDRSGAVPFGNGGFVPSVPITGTSLGRVPGVSTVAWQSWNAYSVDQVTPLAPNPMPKPEAFGGVGELVVSPGPVELYWYPIPGAETYRVQVGGDTDFATPNYDSTVDAPRAGTEPLSEGTYFWRVQALDATGRSGPFSAARPLHIRSGWGSSTMRTEGGLAVPGLHPNQDGWRVHTVPPIGGRKDTRMLQLESQNESGGHAWNVAHVEPDGRDPADSHNAGLALAVMINRAYGGRASQDRLGFTLRAERRRGPEEDLNFGTGLTLEEMERVLVTAVGDVRVERYGFGNDEALRASLRQRLLMELDVGLPVVCEGDSVPSCVVAIGYYVDPADPTDPIIRYNDATGRGYQIDVPWSMLEPKLIMWTRRCVTCLFVDEDGVTADSDNDGIVDFDETDRFGTNPNDPDSDHDGLPDFEEVLMSMFDTSNGHAYGGFGRRSYTIDGDALPPERDADSDDGGCLDGIEDLNGDGKLQFGAGESSPLDREDDSCIAGTYLLDSVDDTASDTQITHTSYRQEAMLSMKPNDDGTLEGLGAITFRYYFQGINLTVTPPCASFIGPIEVTWAVKLTGEFRQGVLNFDVDPPSKTIMLTVGGSCGSQTFPHEISHFVGWRDVTFTDGVFEYIVDTPHEAPNVGNTRVELKLRQEEPE